MHMEDEAFEAPVAVEAVHDKRPKSRKIYLAVGLLAVAVAALFFLMRAQTLPDDNTTGTVIAFNATTLAAELVGALDVPADYRLVGVSTREAPFRMGVGSFQVRGEEMVLEKDGRSYTVYTASGTVEGWRKIVGSGVTVEDGLSENVYSAPYRYFNDTIVFIFWWHNDKIIAVNATQRSEDVIELARKLLSAYPPTESLLSTPR